LAVGSGSSARSAHATAICSSSSSRHFHAKAKARRLLVEQLGLETTWCAKTSARWSLTGYELIPLDS
jgi:hypothetical protein